MSCAIGPIATVNLMTPKSLSTLPAILHVGKLTQNREAEQIPGAKLGREYRVRPRWAVHSIPAMEQQGQRSTKQLTVGPLAGLSGVGFLISTTEGLAKLMPWDSDAADTSSHVSSHICLEKTC